MSQRGLRLTAMATLVAAAATTAAAETSSWSQRTILAPGKSAPAQGNGWNAVPVPVNRRAVRISGEYGSAVMCGADSAVASPPRLRWPGDVGGESIIPVRRREW